MQLRPNPKEEFLHPLGITTVQMAPCRPTWLAHPTQQHSLYCSISRASLSHSVMSCLVRNSCKCSKHRKTDYINYLIIISILFLSIHLFHINQEDVFLLLKEVNQTIWFVGRLLVDYLKYYLKFIYREHHIIRCIEQKLQ